MCCGVFCGGRANDVGLLIALYAGILNAFRDVRRTPEEGGSTYRHDRRGRGPAYRRRLSSSILSLVDVQRHV